MVPNPGKDFVMIVDTDARVSILLVETSWALLFRMNAMGWIKQRLLTIVGQAGE